jgi:hypothetical protein
MNTGLHIVEGTLALGIALACACPFLVLALALLRQVTP